MFQDNLPSLDGAILNASESDCESSDSEISSDAPPLPPPRMESLRQQNEDDNENKDGDEDENESLVSESDSDENESTPPPLPPPRDLDLSKAKEYAISIFFKFQTSNYIIYLLLGIWIHHIVKKNIKIKANLKKKQKKQKLWQTN